jgi:hypothetical protein
MIEHKSLSFHSDCIGHIIATCTQYASKQMIQPRFSDILLLGRSQIETCSKSAEATDKKRKMQSLRYNRFMQNRIALTNCHYYV